MGHKGGELSTDDRLEGGWRGNGWELGKNITPNTFFLNVGMYYVLLDMVGV